MKRLKLNSKKYKRKFNNLSNKHNKINNTRTTRGGIKL